jgi:RNA recognition motif-containing protein
MNKKLYVGNLALGIGNEDLEQLFAEAGVCEFAAVMTDRDTGRSRGFGYVEMASIGDARKAIQRLDGQEFQGRRVCIYPVDSAGV